jgi:hypothetical protein
MSPSEIFDSFALVGYFISRFYRSSRISGSLSFQIGKIKNKRAALPLGGKCTKVQILEQAGRG